MACECGPDFFIYVSAAGNRETYIPRTINGGVEKGQSIEEGEFSADHVDEAWTKIPLNRQITVYARLGENHELYS